MTAAINSTCIRRAVRQPILGADNQQYHQYGADVFTLSGTQLNGIDKGANYGDDAEMAENYPIVELTNQSTGQVYFGRTYNWSSTGVATGSTPVSVQFVIPSNTPLGAYSVAAIANGIPSTSTTLDIVNQPPTINSLSDLNVSENGGLQTVNLSGIGPGAGNETSQVVSISATSSNPALIPNPTVNYTNPNTTGTLSFTPAANVFGTATITVTEMDNGGTANGGQNTTTTTFNVTVSEVNQPRRFSSPPSSLWP